MANILSLKRRINAAKNVSKTTKAMQMIAASKLKKAQNKAVSSKPYTQKLSLLTQDVINHVEDKTIHPYLNQNDNTKTLLIALSPDKGLCGGLISNLVKEFLTFSHLEKNSSYVIVGKKIEGQITRMENEVIASFAFGTITPAFDMVYPIIRIIDEYFVSGKVGSVKILSARFTNLFTQTPQITSLLPLQLAKTEEDVIPDVDYLFEPKAQELLPSLLKHYIEMTLYQLLLESFVSEQAARMIAMQNATDNANDIIEDLRLEYNKTRQAKITSEILDITSGQISTYQ